MAVSSPMPFAFTRGRVVERITAGNTDAETRRTLGLMRKIVQAAATEQPVRAQAELIVRTEGRDPIIQAQAINEWCHDRIQFVRDPVGIEALKTPAMMIAEIAKRYTTLGDCDEAAMLSAALGRSLGLSARFVAAAFLNPRAPFTHVWAELNRPRKDGPWIGMDVTRQDQSTPITHVSRRLVVEI